MKVGSQAFRVVSATTLMVAIPKCVHTATSGLLQCTMVSSRCPGCWLTVIQSCTGEAGDSISEAGFLSVVLGIRLFDYSSIYPKGIEW